jgi:hypothetical protein
MKWLRTTLWLFIALLTFTRPALPVQIDLSWFSIYKDTSHLFIGSLIGAAITLGWIGKHYKQPALVWTALEFAAMAFLPSVVELAVAVFCR